MNFTSNFFFLNAVKILFFLSLWCPISFLLHFYDPSYHYISLRLYIIGLLHLIFNLLIPSCVAVCLIYRTVFLRVPISRFTLFHTCSPCTRLSVFPSAFFTVFLSFIVYKCMPHFHKISDTLLAQRSLTRLSLSLDKICLACSPIR